jgi:hypothetical protein
VPRRAAELAVGGGLEPDLALHGDYRLDRGVLDRAHVVRVQPPGGEVLARGEQRIGPQQAADVIGAERRCRTHEHPL